MIQILTESNTTISLWYRFKINQNTAFRCNKLNATSLCAVNYGNNYNLSTIDKKVHTNIVITNYIF